MSFLIVGLGNPGEKYIVTRHNIGFIVLDFLSKKLSVSFSNEKYGFYSKLQYKSNLIHLLKPNLFMNNSGKSVNYWKNKLKVSDENLLIITDDTNLNFEKTRIRAKGSDGGHNGLKSINNYLGTSNYSRLRIGVGNSFLKSEKSNYVLGEFNAVELSKLESLKIKCVEIVKCFVTQGVDLTMNKFN